MLLISNGIKRGKNAMIDQEPLPTDYDPYHIMPEFDEGIRDYIEGRHKNPYTGPRQGLAAQAWDSGLKYATRVMQHANGQ
jgi:hypothetical protein